MSEKNGKNSRLDRNIQVYIRVRPFSQTQQHEPTCIGLVDQKQISLREKQGIETPSYSFDCIFDMNSTQQQVYNQVTYNIIDNAFQGINGTIFCYGQTSSGKTHTCIGKDLFDPNQKGILPRMIDEILLRSQKLPKNIECKMKISMVEIYNQKIKDLLDSSKVDLKIRSNKSRGIFIQNVTQRYLLSQQEAFSEVVKGIQNRSVGFTSMNSVSSRSHMLFVITLDQHDFYSGQARSAKITLVDLAGSEKISKTGADGKLLQQAKKINASLSALGKVINILSQGKKNHVPYRDSKLTRLLQESLGGNSITKLIINISPSLSNEPQTLSSLRFGHRAKAIKNQPRVNKQFTIPELQDLLSKAENKIKILTQVVKLIMQQKEMERMTVKQFCKFYLKDSFQNFDPNRSQQQLGSTFSKSFSKRNSQQLDSRQLYMQKFPDSINTKIDNILCKNKVKEDILGTDSNLGISKLSKLISPINSQPLNLFRSTNITPTKVNTTSPTKSNKNPSYSKSKNQKIKHTKLKTLESDQQSLLLQHSDIENDQCFKSQQFMLNSPQGKSVIGSSCTFNSRVLDMSFWNPSPKVNKQMQNQICQDDQSTIEFNIQKIRSNLRKIGHMRSRTLIL